MGKIEKTLERVVSGTADANISFADLRALLKHLQFNERIRGDHHIFTRDDIEEILNLQPKRSKVKSYQVKQVRNVIVRYGLAAEVDE